MDTQCTHKLTKIKLIVIFSIIFFSQPLFADGGSSATISWGLLIIGLFGGLALFLYGMGKMSEGMAKSAGNKLRSLLSALPETV